MLEEGGSFRRNLCSPFKNEEGEATPLPPVDYTNFVTVLRTMPPDIYRLLQKVLVDLRLFCAFHLYQANGALCNAED